MTPERLREIAALVRRFYRNDIADELMAYADEEQEIMDMASDLSKPQMKEELQQASAMFARLSCRLAVEAGQ